MNLIYKYDIIAQWKPPNSGTGTLLVGTRMIVTLMVATLLIGTLMVLTGGS